MGRYIELGKKIYNMNNPREVRRMWVFVLRSTLHNADMKELQKFFQSNSVLQRMIEENPFPLEQATRAFFYKDSNFKERVQLIKEHFEFFSNKLKEEKFILTNSCNKTGEKIWEQSFENEQGDKLEALLVMEAGQRKEGLCTVKLNLYNHDKLMDRLYQMMFWVAKDKDDKYSIYIGAMQGPNMENAKDIIKRITKLSHGYRTKNLVLYILQAVARNLGIERIYAVTNEGYYANNHVRIDRKLKTSFSDFWAEAGGEPSEDARFYSLPLVEARKTMEEVPTRKRAVYRRRFAFLDEIDKAIAFYVKAMMR